VLGADQRSRVPGRATTEKGVEDGVDHAPLEPELTCSKRVEWLAYMRTQAAEALGISRSTFNRRVLPYVETLDMPWGRPLAVRGRFHSRNGRTL
jgi:hypothetical protein